MFPEPMIAHFMFIARSPEGHRAFADAFDGEMHAVAAHRGHERAERPGEHDLAGAERDAARAERVDEPGHGGGRRAHRRRARTGTDDRAVLLEPHPAAQQTDLPWRDRNIAYKR